MDIHKQNIIETKDVNEIETNLRTYFDRFNSEISTLQQNLKELRTQNESLAKKNSEISEKNKSQNESSLLLENRFSHEISFLKAETNQKNVQLVELSSELDSLRKQYQHALEVRKIKDQKELALAQETVRLEVEMQKLKIGEDLRIQKIVEDKNIEIEARNQNLGQLQQVLDQTERDAKSRQEKVLELESQIAIFVAEISALKELFEEGITRESKLKERQQDEINSILQKNEKSLASVRKEMESLLLELKAEKLKSSLRDEEINELNTKISNEQKALTQLKEDLEARQTEIFQMKADHERELFGLEDSMKEQIRIFQEDLIKQEECQRKQLTENFKEELKKQQLLAEAAEQRAFEKEMELDQQKTTYVTELTDLAKNFEAEKSELIQTGRRSFEQMKNAQEKELSGLEKNLKEQARAFQKNLQEQERRQESLYKEQLAQQQFLVNAAEQKVSTMEMNLDQQKMVHETALAGLATKFESEKLDLIYASRSELEQMKVTHEKELAALEYNLKEQASAFQKELSLIENRLKEQAHVFQKELQAQEKRQKEQLKAQRTELQSVIDRAEQNIVKKEEELNRQLEEMTLLKATHESVITKQKSAYETEITKQKFVYDTEITKQKSAYADGVKQLSVKFEADKLNLARHTQAEIEQLKTDQANELKAQRTELQFAIDRAEQNIVKKEAELNHQQEEMTLLKATHESEISKKESAYEAEITKQKFVYEAEITKQKSSYAEKIKQLSVKFEADKFDLAQNTQAEIEQLKTAHENELKDQRTKLQDVIDRAEQNIVEKEEELNRQHAEMTLLVTIHEAEINEQKEFYCKEITQLNSAHSADKINQSIKFEVDKLDLTQKVRAEIEELKTSHQNELKAAEQSTIEKGEELNRQKAAYAIEVTQLKTTAATEQMNLSVRFESEKFDLIKNAHSEIEQLKVVYENDQKTTEQKVSEMKMELDRQKAAQFKEVNQLKATHAAERANLSIKFEAEKFDLIQSIDELNAQVANSRRELAQREETNKELNTVTDLLTKKIEAQRQDFEIRKSEFGADKAQMEEKMKAMSQQVKKETQELQAEFERLSTREKQLTHYYQFVSEEKTKYQKSLQQLARQIEFAVTLHPLQDYMAVIEKEISRVECELKKTPSISPHRAQYESMIDQLVQQRDFMRSLITKSEKALFQHKESLERLSRGALGTAAPPPPPMEG